MSKNRVKANTQNLTPVYLLGAVTVIMRIVMVMALCLLLTLLLAGSLIAPASAANITEGNDMENGGGINCFPIGKIEHLNLLLICRTLSDILSPNMAKLQRSDRRYPNQRHNAINEFLACYKRSSKLLDLGGLLILFRLDELIFLIAFQHKHEAQENKEG